MSPVFNGIPLFDPNQGVQAAPPGVTDAPPATGFAPWGGFQPPQDFAMRQRALGLLASLPPGQRQQILQAVQNLRQTGDIQGLRNLITQIRSGGAPAPVPGPELQGGGVPTMPPGPMTPPTKPMMGGYPPMPPTADPAEYEQKVNLSTGSKPVPNPQPASQAGGGLASAAKPNSNLKLKRSNGLQTGGMGSAYGGRGGDVKGQNRVTTLPGRTGRRGPKQLPSG